MSCQPAFRTLNKFICWNQFYSFDKISSFMLIQARCQVMSCHDGHVMKSIPFLVNLDIFLFLNSASNIHFEVRDYLNLHK